MQKITPCLWFDDNIEEAVKFYTSIFKNSKIGATVLYGEASAKASGRPKGTVMTIDFEIEGYKFLGLNGGPVFKFTPAASISVNSDSAEEIDELYAKLSEGGGVLMELDKYPFSDKYGWVNDKFGLSWQLNLSKREQKIAPYLMYTGDQFGKAEEAVNFYVSLFKNSKVEDIIKHGEDSIDHPGTVAHAAFLLNGQEFMALDSNGPHGFGFTPAVSFMVNCEDQSEIDSFWKGLSASGGEEGQCGWVTDKFGVSWQVVPAQLQEMVTTTDAAKTEKIMSEIMKMKKLDVKVLQEAASR